MRGEVPSNSFLTHIRPWGYYFWELCLLVLFLMMPDLLKSPVWTLLLHILQGTWFVLNSAFSNVMLFSGENCAGHESFLEKWTPTRHWFQANSFYLYTGQMGISSHSLSSYKVSGHACPPLAESWRIILYRDCLTAVALPEKQKKVVFQIWLSFQVKWFSALVRNMLCVLFIFWNCEHSVTLLPLKLPAVQQDSSWKDDKSTV